MRIAWLLNLDAEEELADPERPAAARLVQRGEVLARQFAIGPQDVLLPVTGTVPDLGPEFSGQAWCPTPRAQARLRQSGVRVPTAPDLRVLQRVNHREFALAIGPTLAGAAFVRDADSLGRHLGEAPPFPNWVLKRPFGFAGRGRRKVYRAAWFAGAVPDNEWRWVQSSLAGGGLLVEPYVERLRDFALHGFLGVDGALRWGEPLVQICDEQGAWCGAEVAGPGQLENAECLALRAAADSVARALQTAGYFGPFGIDGFRWRDGDGEVRFHPLSDLNARFSLGWPLGMRGWRPGGEDPLRIS